MARPWCPVKSSENLIRDESSADCLALLPVYVPTGVRVFARVAAKPFKCLAGQRWVCYNRPAKVGCRVNTYRNIIILSALVVLTGVVGCARAARDTTGFAMNDSEVINASFEETWQSTKAVLREMDLEIYTRDKRGRFVAFTGMTRRRVFVPHRVKYTIILEKESAETTKVMIESMRQVYGVTLLTYPDWHDRKTDDNSVALEILDRLKTRTSS